MEWYWAGTILFVTVFLFLGLGFPVVFAFMATNLLGAYLFVPGGIEKAILFLLDSSTSSVSTFALVPVPLFVLMGELFFRTGLAFKVFDALDKLFGRIPGRLSYITVGGGTLFAALSGSSIGNTAMLGSLMVPEMMRRGYKAKMVVGPIMGVGALAVIIPPSTLAVLMGSIGQLDVGGLLLAGVVPGVMIAIGYAFLIGLQVRMDPSAAPGYEVDETSLAQKLRAVVINVLPMGLVIFAVIGIIILGWGTPTEASAFGVVSVLFLAAVYRCLTWESLKNSLMGAARVTGMIFFILIGSALFSQLLAFSGASAGMVTWATGAEVERYTMIVLILIIVLILGMFMDQLSIMLITLPILIPIVKSLGFDPVWFGLLMLIVLELGLLTPPFGLLLFVMLGVAPKGTTFGTVVRAALPYIFVQFVVIALVLIFPAIALWLPYG